MRRSNPDAGISQKCVRSTTEQRIVNATKCRRPARQQMAPRSPRRDVMLIGQARCVCLSVRPSVLPTSRCTTRRRSVFLKRRVRIHADRRPAGHGTRDRIGSASGLTENTGRVYDLLYWCDRRHRRRLRSVHCGGSTERRRRRATAHDGGCAGAHQRTLGVDPRHAFATVSCPYRYDDDRKIPRKLMFGGLAGRGQQTCGATGTRGAFDKRGNGN